MTGTRLFRLAPDFVGAVTVTGKRSQSWFFATMVGFTNPGIVAKYDFKGETGSGGWSIYRNTAVKGINPEDFIAEQVWYQSKDGTKVPMFIVRHRNTSFDGTAPAIQYGMSIGCLFCLLFNRYFDRLRRIQYLR